MQPKIVRRTISADTAATLTAIMEGVVERGTGDGARRFPATRSRARPAPRRSSSTAATRTPTTTRRSSASCRRAIRRSRSSSCIDSPHGRTATPAASVSAPVFKRIAEATLRYLGVGADDQSGAAGARRAPRRSDERAPTAEPTPATPVVSLVADGPPGTVPDLRGLSAREAMRTLVQARADRARRRATASSSRRSPAPGAPLEAGRRLPAACSNAPAPPRGSSSAAAMTWAELHGVLRGRGLLARRRRRRRDAAAGAVTGVAYDSRAVAPGQVFVALKGQHADGAAFARAGDRARRGRRSCRSSRRRPASRVPWAVVDDARLALALLAAAFYRHPSARDAGRRHHRHQRQDDDGVSRRVDLRSRGHPLRRARHGRATASATRCARRRARRPKRRTCSGCCARWSTAAAAPARWKCRRTRCRCAASTG